MVCNKKMRSIAGLPVRGGRGNLACRALPASAAESFPHRGQRRISAGLGIGGYGTIDIATGGPSPCALPRHAGRLERKQERGPMSDSRRSSRASGSSVRSAFTLIEMLVAVALTVLLMMMVVSVMSQVMDTVSANRATIEMTDRLRYVRNRLQADLEGITVYPNPPVRPETGQGYFEYVEGPIGAITPAALYSFEPDDTGTTFDFTVGDPDDILMFTSKSNDEPFTGRFMTYSMTGGVFTPSTPTTVQSQTAEIAWFMRGSTLYRRVLLVLPGGVNIGGAQYTIPPALPTGNPPTYSYYGLYDVSARVEDGAFNHSPNASAGNAHLVANSLADLTKRENRYGHQPYTWPYDARFWGWFGLPTLRECSSPFWPFPWNAGANNLTNSAQANGSLIVPLGGGNSLNSRLSYDTTLNRAYPTTIASNGSISAQQHVNSGVSFDLWQNPTPWWETQPVAGLRTGDLSYYRAELGVSGATLQSPGANPYARVAEDVILTNVLSFDVKAYDPGAPVMVAASAPQTALIPQDQWNPTANSNNGQWTYILAMQGAAPVGAASPASYGAFADLNYLFPLLAAGGSYTPAAGLPLPHFSGGGDARSGVGGAGVGPTPTAASPIYPPYASAVYDTWSTSYEQDGIDQDAIVNPSGTPTWKRNLVDEGTDGIDNDGQNGVDDPGEQEAPPPYPYPLRAIQVKIRVCEPDSRQVREVTLVHEFLPQ